MKTPNQVTLVVLTHDRVHELMRHLARMVAWPECPPIIVVDNGSRDGSALLVSMSVGRNSA